MNKIQCQIESAYMLSEIVRLTIRINTGRVRNRNAVTGAIECLVEVYIMYSHMN